MILVDNSVWIDHFRSGEPGLIGWLEAGRARAHLLASVRLTPEALLWTRDQRLASVAAQSGVALAT